MGLTEDEQARVSVIMEWIYDMSKKFGGTCYEKNGKMWDWGQALCRLCYGENWNHYIQENNIETPSWDDIRIAKDWLNGNNPDWQLVKE